MAITEATLGKDHPQYSIGMNNLASLLEKQVKAMAGGRLLEVDVLTTYS